MTGNILIIEDEKPNSDRLQRLIRNIIPEATIKVLESVGESVAWLRSNGHPGVILMDVRLSDGLCFEIFEQVKVDSPIVFTTAYDEYALKAFKMNSIDYLLKPIEQDELEAALAKVDTVPRMQPGLPLDNLIQCLKPTEFRTRFLLQYKDGYKTIRVEDIAYFYSEFKITRAKLHNGTEETIPNTLEELEQQLNPKLFFRANRQYIIHMDAIQFVNNYFNGKLKIVLRKDSNTDIVVSREKAILLKKWLDF
ncbi:MAG: response regulator transcription factor [Bacteroidales bacterium]|nr:response regulator transcription factor [Bacteroidales bacterium]